MEREEQQLIPGNEKTLGARDTAPFPLNELVSMENSKSDSLSRGEYLNL